MIIDYRVLSSVDPDKLELQVKKMLMKENWQLQGGISVAQAGSHLIESALIGGGYINQSQIVFSQAMVNVGKSNA